MKKEIKKLRPVYLEKSFYDKQVAKADRLGLSFSSYVKMCLIDDFLKGDQAKHNEVLGEVSGTVWIVQDTMSGMIAGMFDSQIKAIKYTDKNKGMAIINMEVT